MGEEYARCLPTELEIKVLQHIADEDEGHHPALVECALVCKAWTEHVRRHLYYSINMNTLRGSRQFEVLRKYPYLRPFVRHFKWLRMELERSLDCFDASGADIIKDVAPAVMRLRFCGVDYRALQPPLRDTIPAFANIKELDMMGSIFEDWTTVVRVISSFPLLSILAMPRMAAFRTAAFQDDHFEISYPPPRRLAHIKLASGCETETVSWIRKGSPIPNIQTVEAESRIDSNVLEKLLSSLSGSLRHLIIHIDSSLGGKISHASASRYRLTENTALESIKVVISHWGSIYRDMYRSVITNLIGSICSPHLRSVSLVLGSVVGEVEHFPWEVVNNLMKASPHMLQSVEVALRLLLLESDHHWINNLPPSCEYEGYFRQVRSALPGLDKKLIMRIASQADISDTVSYSDLDPNDNYGDSDDYDDYDDYDDNGNYEGIDYSD